MKGAIEMIQVLQMIAFSVAALFFAVAIVNARRHQ